MAMRVLTLVIGSALIYNSIGASTGSATGEHRKPSQKFAALNIHRSLQWTQIATPVQQVHCRVCKLVIQLLNQRIEDDATQVQVTDMLTGICNGFSGFTREQCRSFLEKYITQHVDVLVQQFTPEALCTTIGVCDSAARSYGSPLRPSSNHDETRLTAQLPRQLKHGAIKTKSLAGYIPSRKANFKGNDVGICIMCEYLVKIFREDISASSTEKEIEEVLEYVCKVVPRTLRDTCTGFIDKYASQILSSLVAGIDPKTICTTLGVCGSHQVSITNNRYHVHSAHRLVDMAVQGGGHAQAGKHGHEAKYPIFLSNDKQQDHVPDKIIQVPGKSNQQPAELKCIECLYIMDELSKILNQNSTKAEVAVAVNTVCESAPKSIKADCRGFVRRFEMEIVPILFTDMTFNTACTRMNLCTGQTQNHHLFLSNGKQDLVPGKVNQQPEKFVCVFCLYMLDELSKTIKPDPTETAVTAAVNKVCDSVPTAVTEYCKQFISYFSSRIISSLLGDLTFDTDCVRINLCMDSKLLGSDGNSDPDVLHHIDLGNRLKAHDHAAQSWATQKHHMSLRNGNQQLHAPGKPNTQKPGVSVCLLCIDIIDELSKVLKPDSTEADITAAVNTACDSEPTTIKEYCHKFLIKFSAKIISTLVADMTFNTSCVRMNMCESSKLLDSDGNIMPTDAHHISPGDRLKSCFRFVKMVNEQTTKFKSADKMRPDLAALCGRTNGLTKNECHVISERYVSMMTKEDKFRGLEPEMVCAPTN